tara:strand:+ start:272 stop:622 length:351 start_codon:yes stop_codon:yes gene_type:complete
MSKMKKLYKDHYFQRENGYVILVQGVALFGHNYSKWHWTVELPEGGSLNGSVSKQKTDVNEDMDTILGSILDSSNKTGMRLRSDGDELRSEEFLLLSEFIMSKIRALNDKRTPSSP